MLETPFWRNAAKSLPPHVRERYANHLEAAERLDLALDAAITAGAHASATMKRMLRRFSFRTRRDRWSSVKPHRER